LTEKKIIIVFQYLMYGFAPLLHVSVRLCHLEGFHTPNLKLAGMQLVTCVTVIKRSIQQLILGSEWLKYNIL